MIKTWLERAGVVNAAGFAGVTSLIPGAARLVGLMMGAVQVASPAAAQQVTGQPGSPSATTTIPGNQLPPPAPAFGGVIKETAPDSTAWWPPRVVPPEGAPNVLLVLVDDSGFATSSTFGG